jgi:hypothetical protein
MAEYWIVEGLLEKIAREWSMKWRNKLNSAKTQEEKTNIAKQAMKDRRISLGDLELSDDDHDLYLEECDRRLNLDDFIE